jgi:GNAT superfamily N-acetyltransferase
MIREYILPKANEPATIQVLKPEHLPQVLALQDATRAALPEDQKMFVLPQPQEYFEKLLDGNGGFMIGISSGPHHIAQMVVMGPLPLHEAVKNNTITRNDVSFHHAEMADLVAVAKSMAVHPDWRGNELSQHLVEAMLQAPAVRDRADHIFAQISAENVRSWEVFLKYGFGITAAAIDPKDNKPRFILQKPVMGFDFLPATGVDDIDPLTGFRDIMRYTELEALIGQTDKWAPSKLAFQANGDTAAAWTEEPARVVRQRIS